MAITRRQVFTWTAPAVLAAVAVPAVSASTAQPTLYWAQHHFGTRSNGVAAVDVQVGFYGAQGPVDLEVFVSIDGHEVGSWVQEWHTDYGQYRFNLDFPGYGPGNHVFLVKVNELHVQHEGWVSKW